MERALDRTFLSVSLIDDDLLSEYGSIREGYLKDFLLADDDVAGLVRLEESVEAFRRSVASRYRTVISGRLSGSDVLSAAD
jgi:hypothetical protein